MFYFYIIVIAFILLKMKNGCFLLRVWFCCDCKRRVISNDTVVLFLLFTYFMFCHNVTICQVFSVSKLQLFEEAQYIDWLFILPFIVPLLLRSQTSLLVRRSWTIVTKEAFRGVYKLCYHNVLFVNYQLLHK